MSIDEVPVGCAPLEDYDSIEKAIFEGTDNDISESIPLDLADLIHRFVERGDNLAFVNPNNEEYVELIIRIPRV